MNPHLPLDKFMADGRTRRNRRRGSRYREERRERAQKLAEERAKRTPQQQLNHLDEMLGKGAGATKERARLQKQIEAGDGKKKED